MTAPYDAADQKHSADAATRSKPLRPVVVAGAVAAVVVSAVGLYALTHQSGGGDAAAGQSVDRRQAVSVAAAQVASFSPSVALTGEVRPRNDLYVFAPSAGVRILELLVDAGDQVTQGQPLARLDTALAEAQLSAAQATVAEAAAAQLRAADEYARAQSIADSGALSTEQIEQRGAASAAADARLAAAQAQLAEMEARLQGGFVRAPVSGLVIERTARLGAPAEGQALFRIAGGGSLEAAVQVAESDILALPRGARAEFTLVDGTTVIGELVRLPAAIDVRTRTGEAVFALPRDRRVRAGMFVRGEARLADRQALSVPAEAVMFENGEPYVYVISDDAIARRTPVAIGARSGDLIEIREGLSASVRVAASGGAFLQDGDSVTPVEPAAVASAG
jgi:RND family efflux transporter MFP subunit